MKQEEERIIEYKHYYLDKRFHRHYIVMVGMFDKKDTIYVHPYGTRYKIKEELLYSDKAFECGVIKILSMSSFQGHMNHYEVRVWNSSNVPMAARACLPVLAKQKIRVRIIYKEMCQNMYLQGQSKNQRPIQGQIPGQIAFCNNEI